MQHHGISIVIPAFNEEHGLPHIVKQLAEDLAHRLALAEIIIVDDGSTDHTWHVVQNLGQTYPVVRALRFARNFGKESAIYAGLQQSTGTAAVIIDADLQHPPMLIPDMVALWEKENVHIVEAVKEIRQPENRFRRLGATLFYAMFKRLGLQLKDSTDFKLLDRIVIDQYLKFPERNRFFRGLTAWMGFSRATIPFVPEDRDSSLGASRWTLIKLIDMARNSLFAFTTIPLRIISWLGMATLGISIFLGIQTLWNKWKGHAVEGFATVILIQLFTASIIMISLGLIGKYLSYVYEEVKNRPIYIVSESLRGDSGVEPASVSDHAADRYPPLIRSDSHLDTTDPRQ